MAEPTASALITGANSGIGKEVARQLAEHGGYGRVYLACRNPAKADAARLELERVTGESIFTTLQMDTSDLRSVADALEAIREPLTSVVMNAGGAGGPTPIALTSDGVTEIFASNVLGHAALLEALIASERLTGSAVLVGSEAARGVPKLGIKRPTFAEHSVTEFVGIIDGSFFADRKLDDVLAYGQAKYLGALWMAELARRHPGLRLLTVSPGNTAGTDVFRDMGAVMRPLMNHVLMPYVLPRFGLAHPLSTGARRLVDAVVSDDLASGGFYASAAKTLTGPVVDQATVVAAFGDPEIQGHAYEAIHRFL
ncbi:SDR family NAD(P)-dependent oxidoreductase [Mycolicibacterium moriokaense]|nr:SDR family NAD(P)-dependent oxidoreductase [Mycolicibacterium moriokaense]